MIFGERGENSTRALQAGHTVVDETPEVINAHTAKEMAKYFQNDPRRFAYLLNVFVGKLKKRARYADTHKPLVLPREAGVLSSIRRLRLKRAQRLSGWLPTTEKFYREVRALNVGGGELEAYILRNMDELDALFTELPIKWTEAPFHIIFQGMPQREALGGTRYIDGLYGMANKLMVRTLFKARSQLLYQIGKRQSREILQQGPEMIHRSTPENIRSFQRVVSNAIQDATPEKARALSDVYERAQDAITSKIVESFGRRKRRRLARLLQKHASENPNLSEQDFLKQILFSPRSASQSAASDTIWESISSQKVFKIEEVGESVLQTTQRLSQRGSINLQATARRLLPQGKDVDSQVALRLSQREMDQFDNELEALTLLNKYYNALKLAEFKKRPDVVEIL